MSTSNSNGSRPDKEFQSHFGNPPGTKDAQTECKQWEQLCGELLTERMRLQAELARAEVQNKANERAIAAMVWKDSKFDMTMEEVFAQVDKETSLEQIIAELEAEAEKQS
jgi:hypothetical protein